MKKSDTPPKSDTGGRRGTKRPAEDSEPEGNTRYVEVDSGKFIKVVRGGQSYKNKPGTRGQAPNGIFWHFAD